MKLIIFVTEDATADAAVDALVEQKFRVTRLATTGGFLRRGNTTLLVGLEESQVEQAKALVQKASPGSLAIVMDLERYERL
jgi:uncharacterized protein YaaQ